MPYYTEANDYNPNKVFARYAEIMPYYTKQVYYPPDIQFARYAEIMPYYTLIWEE